MDDSKVFTIHANLAEDLSSMELSSFVVFFFIISQGAVLVQEVIQGDSEACSVANVGGHYSSLYASQGLYHEGCSNVGNAKAQ